METIGEIEVPPETSTPIPDLPYGTTVAPSVSSTSGKKSKSNMPSRSFMRSRKESSSSSKNSLGSTTHLLPPLPPVPAGSTLDLPADMFAERDKSGTKRGSIMGSFKVRGLRKWRDDQSSRTSFVTDSQSMGSTLSLSKIGSNTCKWALGPGWRRQSCRKGSRVPSFPSLAVVVHGTYANRWAIAKFDRSSSRALVSHVF